MPRLDVLRLFIVLYIQNQICFLKKKQERRSIRMTKEEMQRFLIKEAQRGSAELEAYRNLMEILGIEFPIEKDKTRE